MNKVLISIGLLLMSAVAVQAASVMNSDAEPLVLMVTEDGTPRDVTINAGASVTLCPNGCFIKPPKDDKITLSGNEEIEIINGRAVFK